MHISTTYHIAGNFQGRKLSWISEKYDFHGLLTFAVPKDTMLPNFTEKTFAKLRNSRKYSPSKVSRYTVCVQEFFHSTTDTVRVGLNVMIMEAVKWLRRWENFWHHFYQRSQSLECDFKAHPPSIGCLQHTNKDCYCFTGWVGSLIGLHIVVSSNLSSLSFLQLHWVKKNHHLSESKSVSRFATNTTAVPTPMSRFEARWILRIGLIIIYTISVSSQVQVSSHSTMICVSIVIKEQHSQFRCCDIWPLKSLKFALSRTNMCTVPTKTYP